MPLAVPPTPLSIQEQSSSVSTYGSLPEREAAHPTTLRSAESFCPIEFYKCCNCRTTQALRLSCVVDRETLELASLSVRATDEEQENEDESEHIIDEDTDDKSHPGDETATIPNEIFNLVKNIVGSGGFSLPSGVAAFGNDPSALIPAAFIIMIMGLLNAYSFSLIGRVCSVTRSRTYKQAWDRSFGTRVVSKNHWASIAVAWTVVGKTLLGCWAFSIVMGSSVQPLLVTAGWYVSRANALLGVTVVVLLPLCMVRNLSTLAGCSFVGGLGTLLAAGLMLVRYFDGSYREGGQYYDNVPDEFKPYFGNDGASAVFKPEALILVCILSTGYVAHYNAPKFYFELTDHTTERFNVVVGSSFLFSAVIYGLVSTVGFLTFGGNSSGYILDNYATTDPLATVARVGIVVSLVFAYPLLFIGARDGTLDLWKVPVEARTTSLVRVSTIALLSLITFLAIFVSDLTFVLAFGGATLSTAVIYVFPPLMFRATVLNLKEKATPCLKREVQVAMLILYSGIAVGACGAVIAVLNSI